MKLGIMQPYIFPYIGYFQLINAVDKFVLYDNIQFTKKGWINRNRILVNGAAEYFTIPLKKDSDYLNVVDRKLSDSFTEEKTKLLRKISGAYTKAPFFSEVFPVIESIFERKADNLFHFIHQALLDTCNLLDIKTEIIVSSAVDIDHRLKSQEKVLAICKTLQATQYFNPIGGVELYDKEDFNANHIQLNFLQADAMEYPQLKNEFVPWLSIIDVLMFNESIKIKEYIQSGYSIK